MAFSHCAKISPTGPESLVGTYRLESLQKLPVGGGNITANIPDFAGTLVLTQDHFTASFASSSEKLSDSFEGTYTATDRQFKWQRDNTGDGGAINFIGMYSDRKRIPLPYRKDTTTYLLTYVRS